MRITVEAAHDQGIILRRRWQAVREIRARAALTGTAPMETHMRMDMPPSLASFARGRDWRDAPGLRHTGVAIPCEPAVSASHGDSEKFSCVKFSCHGAAFRRRTPASTGYREENRRPDVGDLRWSVSTTTGSSRSRVVSLKTEVSGKWQISAKRASDQAAARGQVIDAAQQRAASVITVLVNVGIIDGTWAPARANQDGQIGNVGS